MTRFHSSKYFVCKIFSFSLSATVDQAPCQHCGPSCCGSPLSSKGMESSHPKLWTCDQCPYLFPSQGEMSMEEEEEGEEEEEKGERTQDQLFNTEVSRASSDAVLLSEPQDISYGLVNPAFSHGDSLQSCRSRPSSQWGRPVKSPRWACMFRDGPYGHCRSLSSSVENMTFSGAMRGSFPSLNDPVNKEILSGGRIFRDNTSLRCSRSRGIVEVFNARLRKQLFITS